MRITNNHHHAFTEYNLVNKKHYMKLLWSFIICKIKRGSDITIHVPYELMHIELNDKSILAFKFIAYGEWLKRIFHIPLYWENAPWLDYGTWDLKYIPAYIYFELLPTTIEYCLDTGHVMLGMKSKKNAVNLIKHIIDLHGSQIKFLHLHENDLVHDFHLHTDKILTREVVNYITCGRDYVWEGR